MDEERVLEQLGQLSFSGVLFKGVAWEGRSPRVLTRHRLSFIFNQRGQEDGCFFVDPDQLLIWPVENKPLQDSSWRGPTAPTLLPLPRRHDAKT